MLNKKIGASVALVICGLVSSSTHALDLNAGDYDPAPAGTTIANLYLHNGLHNSLYIDNNALPDRNRLHTQIGIVSVEHYMNIGGMLAVPLAILPFGQISETIMGNSLGKDSGLGDLILGLPFWVYNNPEQHRYVTVAPFLYLPTGSYDAHQAVNLGQNRYRGTLQVAYSTRLTPQIAWDIAADATVHGDNTDAVGGGTRSQKIGYQLQTNARYLYSAWTDFRAGISYLDAGATKQNGVKTEANTESKFWLGTGVWTSQKTQVILTYGRDIRVDNGFKDDNQINMKLMHIF